MSPYLSQFQMEREEVIEKIENYSKALKALEADPAADPGRVERLKRNLEWWQNELKKVEKHIEEARTEINYG